MKIRTAILGSGNIGTDLMYKLRRSRILLPVMMAGIIPESDGLARARESGLETTHEGIDGLLRRRDSFDIVFDATTAAAHVAHAPLLEQAGKVTIDLTPAAVGPYVIPLVNLEEHVGAPNVNLVSCGGQATVPLVSALKASTPVAYAEIVATIASKSAGPGTRKNIDEFTETTARGLETIGGAARGKAVIVLNPAEPPILMQNTVYAIVDTADPDELVRRIREMVVRIQDYVQGYRLRAEPLVEDFQDSRQKVTLYTEVRGAGDYLPEYAGNLDIMTSAAVKVGEEIGRRLREGTWVSAQEARDG